MKLDHENPKIEAMCRALCRVEGVDPDGNWRNGAEGKLWWEHIPFCAGLYRQQVALNALKNYEVMEKRLAAAKWDAEAKKIEEEYYAGREKPGTEGQGAGPARPAPRSVGAFFKQAWRR